MIRTEDEYLAAKGRLQDEAKRLKEHRLRFTKELKLPKDQVKRAMEPLTSFHLQLKEEVQAYERAKRGSFDAIENLRGLGPLLIALRIHKGWSQTRLASELGVDPSQVSRDERNDYRSITVERAIKTLEALGARMTSQVD